MRVREHQTTSVLLDSIAEHDPDTPLLYASGFWLRAGQAATQGKALARALYSRGLRKGDVISVQMPNWSEIIAIDYAAAKLGLIINPIVLIYRAAEISEILADCRAKAIFIPQSFGGHDYRSMIASIQHTLPDLQNVITMRGDGDESFDALITTDNPEIESVEVQIDDPKMLMYTSGTTGHAKGVIHSHRTLSILTHNTASNYQLEPDDRCLVLGPVGHLGGYLFAVLFPTLVLSPAATVERWDVGKAAQLVEELELTYATGATAFLQDMLSFSRNEGWNWPSLRLFACGGAAVPPKVIEDFATSAQGRIAFRCYGMTEAPNAAMRRPGPFDLKSAATTDGFPNGFEFLIMDDDGNPRAPNQEGEVRMRGPALMLGYIRAEDNVEAFDENGFFRSGDLGYMDDCGNITITGRIKDLIIRGGENLSAKEIEDVIQMAPGVERVAIVGLADPDARLGESIAAFVIPEQDNTLELSELNESIRNAGLARQKQIENLFLVRALPLTPFGKVRKNILRSEGAAWASRYQWQG